MPGGLEQRGEQCVLVLAVAVLVGEHVVGSMRLVAADAEIEAHVMNVQGDFVEDGVQLVLIGSQPLCQRIGAGLDRRCDGERVFLERGIPRANLLPSW